MYSTDGEKVDSDVGTARYIGMLIQVRYNYLFDEWMQIFKGLCSQANLKKTTNQEMQGFEALCEILNKEETEIFCYRMSHVLTARDDGDIKLIIGVCPVVRTRQELMRYADSLIGLSEI